MTHMGCFPPIGAGDLLPWVPPGSDEPSTATATSPFSTGGSSAPAMTTRLRPVAFAV